MDFVLNPRLEAVCFEITRLRGCRVLLKNDSNFPWFIIVPEVAAGIEDLHGLDEETFHQVTTAIREVSEFASQRFTPEKLNVACIGNIVRQMHIHVVARFTTDPAWPGVVWAFEGKSKYAKENAAEIITLAKKYFESLSA